ncbi:hypothetical protein B0H17DRAFT_1148670 [Mycena rosella]|uniref:Uncharacterized protein n=1 Tax=Mycena rosella TaxID=1033263 RepID=A0AAD7CBP6_MYCRO|nr:hypothetical protein B0H17DRAFT_1148670 [Mycena rosella]
MSCSTPDCSDGSTVTTGGDNEVFERLLIKSHLLLVIKHGAHHSRCLGLLLCVGPKWLDNRDAQCNQSFVIFSGVKRPLCEGPLHSPNAARIKRNACAHQMQQPDGSLSELFEQQYRIQQPTVTIKKGSSITGISLPTKQNSRIRIQYRKPNRPTDQINRIRLGRHTRITKAEQAEHTEKPEDLTKFLVEPPLKKYQEIYSTLARGKRGAQGGGISWGWLWPGLWLGRYLFWVAGIVAVLG